VVSSINLQQKLEELYNIELAISIESVVIKYLCREHQVRLILGPGSQRPSCELLFACP